MTLILGTVGHIVAAMLDAGIAPFVIASLILGLGFAFYSGSVEAWLVDALAATGHEGPLDRVFARGSIVSVGAVLGSMVASLRRRAGLLGRIAHHRPDSGGRGRGAAEPAARLAESTDTAAHVRLPDPRRVPDVGLLRLAALCARALGRVTPCGSPA